MGTGTVTLQKGQKCWSHVIALCEELFEILISGKIVSEKRLTIIALCAEVSEILTEIKKQAYDFQRVEL